MKDRNVHHVLCPGSASVRQQHLEFTSRARNVSAVAKADLLRVARTYIDLNHLSGEVTVLSVTPAR